MKKGLPLRKMTVVGLLGGLSIVLGMTPLGFIPLGPANITIMHIPVIIAAIIEGPLVGALVGLIFGISSLARAIITPTIISPALYNPLISVLPRVMIGVVAGFSYRYCKDHLGKYSRIILPTVLGTLTNTVGVLAGLYFFYGRELAEKLGGDSASLGKGVLAIGITNGIPEIIVASIIVTAVVSKIKMSRRG